MLANPRFSRACGVFLAEFVASKSRLNLKGLHRPPAGRESCRKAQKKPKRARAGERDKESTHVAGEEPIIPTTAGRFANTPSDVSTMAGRYATALFELAAEAKAVDAVKTDLDRFDALLGESTDLLRLVRSPVFSIEQQSEALAAVLQRAGVGGLAANFLKLVTANRRLFAVRDMIKSYRALVAKAKGEATAEVTVAETLKDEHVKALRAALKAVSGKDVDLDIKIDPAIIGGLVVKLGSRMVDTSLRTKLNAIKHAMKEAR
jgi:F-type H+-transporting ATPase subunit delta